VASEQAGYEADLEQAMAEVSRLNELMRQDRADIERLRGEAWALRAETRAVLAAMGAQL
jgi:hypothetical protein